MAEFPSIRSFLGEVATAAQREYGPDFSPQYKFHLAVQSVLGYFFCRAGSDVAHGFYKNVLFHASERFD